MDGTREGVGRRGRVVWEEVACPLCGADDKEEVLVVPGEAPGDVYRLVRCRACGMAYLSPRPDRASIIQFYSDEYHPYQPPPRETSGGHGPWRHWLQRLVNARAFGDPPPLTRWSHRALAALATPWLRADRDSLTALPFHGHGRLLDFGCGSGWYARRMCDRGWDVTAMDFNPRTAEQVAKRYGLRTLAGTLPHPHVKAGSFDMVVMGSSLEHVHCPHQVIGAAKLALRPGGRLVVVVPNLGAAAFGWFGVDWWPLDLPRHLLHFSPPALRRLMAMHGLEVVELRTLAHAKWMRLSLANRRHRLWRPTGRRWLARLSKVRLVASLLNRYTGWAGQADALRVIACRPDAAA
jgi:SAM-dependent methyltransferase